MKSENRKVNLNRKTHLLELEEHMYPLVDVEAPNVFRNLYPYDEVPKIAFNDRIVPVKADEIAFFYSEDKNNHVVTHGGAVYIVDSTMDSLITDLDPERFFRISRSCIFAKDAIECVTKLLGGRLRVTPKVQLSSNLGPAPDLTVSRSRAEDFLGWLES